MTVLMKDVFEYGKNKLDGITFCKLLDLFGEEVARDILWNVNSGNEKAEDIEKRIFTDETKEEYKIRLQNE